MEPTTTNGNGSTKGNGKVKVVEEATLINIPAIRIERVEVQVSQLDAGASLIMNKWSQKALEMMRAKQQGAAFARKDPKDPLACWNDARYLDSKGMDGIPSLMFKQAIVDVASFFGKEVSKVVLRGAIFVEGDIIPIEYDGVEVREDSFRVTAEPRMRKPKKGEEPTMEEAIETRVRGSSVKLEPGRTYPQIREDAVRVGMGAADLRYRPEYINWRCTVPLQVNPRVISVEQAINLLNLAGFSIGVGEWRPQCNGQHGRFKVVGA